MREENGEQMRDQEHGLASAVCPGRDDEPARAADDSARTEPIPVESGGPPTAPPGRPVDETARLPAADLPTEPLAAAATPTGGKGRRRLWQALAACVLLALLVAGGLAGYVARTNRDRADAWQRVADELAAQNAGLKDVLEERTEQLNLRTGDLNDMALKVEDLQAALQRSEGDVRSLERRQRQLAAEKAAIEDERAQLAVAQDALLEEQAALQDVVAAMADCNVQVTEAYNALLNDDFLLDLEVDEANRACDAAYDAWDTYNAAYGG